MQTAGDRTDHVRVTRYMLTHTDLNRVGHIVNGIVNYCFYGKENAEYYAQDIIRTVVADANFTQCLNREWHTLFSPPVGAHWLDLIHDTERQWVSSMLYEASEIIRDVILQNGLYHDVVVGDNVRQRASLLTVVEYMPFRHLTLEDNLNDSWVE